MISPPARIVTLLALALSLMSSCQHLCWKHSASCRYCWLAWDDWPLLSVGPSMVLSRLPRQPILHSQRDILAPHSGSVSLYFLDWPIYSRFESSLFLSPGMDHSHLATVGPELLAWCRWHRRCCLYSSTVRGAKGSLQCEHLGRHGLQRLLFPLQPLSRLEIRHQP